MAAEKALLVANGLRPKDTTVLCLLGMLLMPLIWSNVRCNYTHISDLILDANSSILLVNFNIAGDARQKLCRLEESLECYNRTLDLDSRDVLALKGRADINLAKAYQYYSLGSMGQVSKCDANSMAFCADLIW